MSQGVLQPAPQKSNPQRAPSFTPVRSGVLQRKCACGGTPGSSGECEACRKKRLQRAKTNTGVETQNDSVIPSIVYEVLRAPGRPLDAETRSFMEPRFGHDFSHVRVHTDARATESAQRLDARAYTVGSDLIFGRGQYSPRTSSGRQLLAHELTHSMQQRMGVNISDGVGQAGDVYERHADAVSRRVVQGESVIPLLAKSPINRLDATQRASFRSLAIQFQKGGEDVLKSRTAEALDPTSNPATGAIERVKLDAQQASEPQTNVYLCSKVLDRSPIGTHAFFRVGGDVTGSPTFSLLPEDRGGNCWQGQPKKNFSSDVNANAKCIPTRISQSCLENQYTSYPIGHYCTLGPNSNTFAGCVARNCGMTNPDPPGWNPGIDDGPPPTGTFADSPESTVLGCKTKTCSGGATGKSELRPIPTYGVTPVQRNEPLLF